MSRPKFTDVDTYIASFPTGHQEVLQRVRALIRKAAPKAEEMISYNIPAYKQDGQYVIYFAGYTGHVGMYPIPKGDAALQKDIKPHVAGKGTVRFELDTKLPTALMTRIVKAGLADAAARAKAKAEAKKKK